MIGKSQTGNTPIAATTEVIMCPEVSFFFQFSAFMMLMVATLMAVAFGYYWDRNFNKPRPVKLRRGRKK